MDIPVSVTTHKIEVTVTETSVNVLVTATVQTIAVTVNYGIAVHNLLSNRDAEAAHPASSITYGDGNVQEILDNRFLSVDAGTNINIDNTDPQRPIINVDQTSTFTDTLITGLKSDAETGGEIPANTYNWFKGLYAALVDGSVKSFINGLLSVVNGLATRVGVIEDNAYFDFFKIPTKHLRQYDYFNAARTSATSSTTGAPMQDVIMLIPISLTDDITIDYSRSRVYTAFAGGKMRIGIYEGNPFYPYNLIWQSDEMTQDASGLKVAPVAITLAKGKMYWFAFITNNITVRMYSYQIYQLSPIKANDAVTSNVHSILFANYSYGVLPATLEGLTVSEAYTFFPIISLRKA